MPLLGTGPPSVASSQKAQGAPSLQSELSKASVSSADSSAVKGAARLSDLSEAFFRAPPGLPSSELAALRQASAKAASSAALKAQAAEESLPVSFTGGAIVAGQAEVALGQANAIAPFVNGKG